MNDQKKLLMDSFVRNKKIDKTKDFQKKIISKLKYLTTSDFFLTCQTIILENKTFHTEFIFIF